MMEQNEIRKKLKKTLDKERYEHTKGVMYTAGCLAMANRYPIENAMLAGLLHDCAKCLSTAEKIRLCEDHHILMTAVELENPGLLHAKAGMALAEEQYGVTDPDILHAIKVHTTGEPDMSILDKIIYIADYIEPNRKIIPGLQEIRETVFVDIDHAICLCAGNTVNYLRKNGKPVDPMSIETYQYYSDKGE